MKNPDRHSLHNESSLRFQNLFEQMSTGLVICRLNGEFVDINGPFCTITGYSKEELLNMSFQDITFPDDLAYDLASVKQLTEGSIDSYTIEKRYIRKNRDIIWVKLYVSAIIAENNHPTYLVGSVVDVTNQKKSIDALRESEAKFQKAFSSSPDCIIISSLKDGRYIDINDTFLRLSEYTRDEIIGYSSLELSIWNHPDDRARFIEIFNKEGRVRDFEAPYRTKTGKQGIVSISAEIIEIDNEACILAQSRDITEKRKSEDEIKMSEEKFAKLFRSSPDAIMLTRLSDGILTDLNDSVCDIIGFTKAELIGKSTLALNIWVNKKEREQYIELLRNNQRVKNFEAQFRTKSGEVKIGIISGEIIHLHDGVYTLGIIRDITSRKQAEEALLAKNKEYQTLNKEYYTLNKELSNSLERIQIINNQLAYAKTKAEENDRLKTSFLQNMSHEIRTPMNAIMGFADLLEDHLEDKAKLVKYTSIIKQRSADLLEIINDILDIAKIESGQLPLHLEKCELKNILNDIEKLFNEYRKRINKYEIEFNLDLNCKVLDSEVITDPGKIKQILINLINNAFKFTESGRVEVGCNIVENNTLSFYVSDTGIGIPKDKQAEIFERFRQANHDTATLYGGTGLGLSIVQGLLDLLGGTIRVESEIGKGSTFYFTIPYQIGYNITPKQPLNVDTNDQLNKEITILLVEDDQLNVEYLKIVLSKTNYYILHTEFGKEAVEIALTQNIDLVLMDIRLPDISGYEAVRLIKQQKPYLKIIAQTAYAAISDRQKALEAGCDEYISKPIAKDDLLQLIEKIFTK